MRIRVRLGDIVEFRECAYVVAAFTQRNDVNLLRLIRHVGKDDSIPEINKSLELYVNGSESCEN